MKERLQCDSCGGKLIAQGEYFVCESCGVGYKIYDTEPKATPCVSNVIINNPVNPNKVSSLSSQFREFARAREYERGKWW